MCLSVLWLKRHRLQKTVEVLQSQLIEWSDVLVVMQRQSSTIQKLARTTEIPQAPFIDRIVDVIVVIQRQVPTFQKMSIQTSSFT